MEGSLEECSNFQLWGGRDEDCPLWTKTEKVELTLCRRKIGKNGGMIEVWGVEILKSNATLGMVQHDLGTYLWKCKKKIGSRKKREKKTVRGEAECYQISRAFQHRAFLAKQG